MNMKRCILDPKLTRQLTLALRCRGMERTVRAHGTLIALVLWEGDREMRDKKLAKTQVDTERRVIVWWEITAHSVVAPRSWGITGQRGCCSREEQLDQSGKGFCMSNRTALTPGFIITIDGKRVCSGAEEPLGALSQLVLLGVVCWGRRQWCSLGAITTAAACLAVIAQAAQCRAGK